MKWLYVFIGSGIGGCLRLFTTEISRRFFNGIFPVGTFLSNVIACIILGIAVGMASSKLIDERLKLFLTVGICGGFSTFSTFSNEALQLFSQQKTLWGLVYVSVSVITCIAGVYIGMLVTKQF